jgi:hypothetical protein
MVFARDMVLQRRKKCESETSRFSQLVLVLVLAVPP